MKTQHKINLSFGMAASHTAAAAPGQDGTQLDNRGFSLIELVLVCALLGIIVAIAVPSYSQLTDRARISRCAEEIRSIEKSVSAFQADRGFLPGSLADVGQENLKDPWGNLYVYHAVNSGGWTAYAFPFGGQNTDFDLYSKGSDGTSLKTLAIADPMEPTSLNDIVRASDGAWVGLGRVLVAAD